MGRIDPLVIVFYQLPPLEAEFVAVKLHGIGVAGLNVQHDLIDIGHLPVLLRFEVLEDGRYELGSDAPISIGGEDPERHNVYAASSRTSRDRWRRNKS